MTPLKMQGRLLLHNIISKIREYEATYQRSPHAVSLLASSKGQSVDKMRATYLQGQRAFGENYVQEALEKMQALSDCEIEWHFIGAIQSNKTKKIAEHFSVVQSVSSEKIAQRLNDQRPLSMPPLNICIEVNIDHETTKQGVFQDELFALLKYCCELSHLTLRGLMCIPAIQHDFNSQCAAFHAMAELWRASKQYLGDQAKQFDTLSMGMSADFEAAIKEGSTMVRIGTALFGERQ